MQIEFIFECLLLLIVVKKSILVNNRYSQQVALHCITLFYKFIIVILFYIIYKIITYKILLTWIFHWVSGSESWPNKVSCHEEMNVQRIALKYNFGVEVSIRFDN